ncbi:hypothetical protein [Streptomyces lavendulae]|uniref:hypothetical protein n=1 Tax=Streptomyces lavendulae TaxID=1914 RepID=UPI0024A098F4|nr:hypothetical protein [Streptomyces lavendulae]GLX18934.1 hypothetical protein Slala01_25780 [Streptomyces lavendulae subsp. lavendulae]GLX29144.1 hypothetical protein Slala02_49640 [Streptomyces lavendulae subsp. lavendulae]
MISTEFTTTTTDVVTCEACWRNPVQAARITTHTTRRDLLCVPCAQQNSPTRVDLFPPLGIYKLTWRNTTMGKHRNPGYPEQPPNPGPPLPSPPPSPTPGRPPV